MSDLKYTEYRDGFVLGLLGEPGHKADAKKALIRDVRLNNLEVVAIIPDKDLLIMFYYEPSESKSRGPNPYARHQPQHQHRSDCSSPRDKELADSDGGESSSDRGCTDMAEDIGDSGCCL